MTSIDATLLGSIDAMLSSVDGVSLAAASDGRLAVAYQDGLSNDVRLAVLAASQPPVPQHFLPLIRR